MDAEWHLPRHAQVCKVISSQSGSTRVRFQGILVQDRAW